MNKNFRTYAVVIVMSIIIVISVTVGTYAYFSATAQSSDEAIASGSNFVSLTYTDSKNMISEELIPASKTVALASYNNQSKYGQCKDDNDRSVCSIYSFQVENSGDIDQDLVATVKVNTNEFKNLYYIVYDMTDENNIVEIASGKFKQVENNEGYSFNIFGDEVTSSIELNQTNIKKYEIVSWLNEIGENQNYEQGNKFFGTVIVSLTDASRIQGIIEANK